MPEHPFTPDEIKGVEILWLLSVTWGGRVFYWSNRSVDIDDADGDPIHYDGGLEVDFEQSISMFDESPANPSVSINDLQLPQDVDAAEWVEQGRILERAPAELSLWCTGRTFEKRWVRVVGFVSMASYGSAGQPISFDIEPSDLIDYALIPDSDARVTTETWADTADEEVGKYYPIVFGQPGIYADSDTEFAGGSPAYLVDKDRILVCGAPTYKADGTADVEIINKTALDSNTFDVEIEADGLGRRCAVCDVTASGPLTINSGDEYWARWDSTVTNAEGGIPNWTNTGPMTGAGDVIRYLLNQSTVKADTGRIRAIEDKLNRIKLDCFIDQPVSPWEFCRTQILPLLPVSAVSGPSGLYLVWWDRDATDADAVAHLDASRGMDRIGLVQVERSEVMNEIRLGFRPRADDGQSYLWRTSTGKDVGVDSTEMWTSQHAAQSRRRYGERSKVIESPIVYSTATAGAILAWMARAYAFPWRTVEYSDPSSEIGYLQVGDVVTITDSELHLSSRVAIVRSVAWQDSSVSITLVLIDDPVRDVRPT